MYKTLDCILTSGLVVSGFRQRSRHPGRAVVVGPALHGEVGP